MHFEWRTLNKGVILQHGLSLIIGKAAILALVAELSLITATENVNLRRGWQNSRQALAFLLFLTACYFRTTSGQ